MGGTLGLGSRGWIGELSERVTVFCGWLIEIVLHVEMRFYHAFVFDPRISHMIRIW